MHLVIFDIDGTVLDSVGVDDQCYIQAFKELHDLDLSGADWNQFKHVTDSGLTNEIFERHFQRQPATNEIATLKSTFYALLEERKDQLKEIKGAKETLHKLTKHSGFKIAFATGGWKETALLKLSSIGFDLGKIPLRSANDHFKRAEIIKLAISDCHATNSVFESITYVGDGLWDLRASSELNINFIGIDAKQNHKLRQAGANRILPDLHDLDQLLRWLDPSGGSRVT